MREIMVITAGAESGREQSSGGKTAPQGGVDSPSAATGTGSEATELPLDVIFGLLSNERRRLTIRYLLETETTELGSLAEHIAAIENDKPERALTTSERKRVYIVLYQSHLPKMADANVIDYDEARKTIEPGENIEQVARFLPGVGSDDSSGGLKGRTTAFAQFVRAVGRWFRITETP